MSCFGGGEDGDGALLMKILASQQRLESKLDKLLAAFDLQEEHEAIRRLRELSGLGLAEARTAVEQGRY